METIKVIALAVVIIVIIWVALKDDPEYDEWNNDKHK